MSSRCIYCGREIEIGATCRTHADLFRRDPHFNALVTKRWSDLRSGALTAAARTPLDEKRAGP